MHLEGLNLGAEEKDVSLVSPVEWLNAQDDHAPCAPRLAAGR